MECIFEKFSGVICCTSCMANFWYDCCTSCIAVFWSAFTTIKMMCVCIRISSRGTCGERRSLVRGEMDARMKRREEN